MLHAWFSEKQAKTMKTCPGAKKWNVYKIYANEHGKEVCATMVSDTKEHKCKYDDLIYLGLVNKFLRCQADCL